MNVELGLDSEITITTETISIAGEDHPAYVETYTNEEGDSKNATVFLLKSDFACDITIMASPETFDRLAELVEKN